MSVRRSVARRLGLRLTAGVVTTLVGASILVPAYEVEASASGGTGVQDASQAPDPASARTVAQKYGHRVEVTNLDDASSTTFVNADGTFSTESHAGPIRVSRGGKWYAVDTTLHASNGKVAPGAVPADVQLSAGGTGALVQAAGDRGTIGYSWKGNLPAPVLSGDTAVYPQVQPGVDLIVKVTRTGFEVSARLTQRPTAPVEIRLPLITKGVTAHQRADGGLDLKNNLGKAVFSSDAPVMFDTSSDAHTGNPVRHAQVSSVLDTSGAAPVLVLRPDLAFLSDPTVTYPVLVDPYTNLTDSADTWVESDYSSSQYSSTELRAGTYNSGSAIARSYLKFSTAAVTGKHVLSADLKLYEFHSWSCTAEYLNVYRLGAAFSSSTVWSNKPANGTYITQKSFAHGYSSSCPSAWETIPVTSLVQSWASGTYTNYGITLAAASETNSYYWKKFNSADASSGDPYIYTTYNSYPNTPGLPSLSPRTGSASPYWTTTKTPTIKATVSDPDGGTVYGQFRIYSGSTLIWQANSPGVSSGGTASLAVPAGKLVDGTLYTIRVYGYDGTDLSKTWSTSIQFKVDSTLPSAATVTSTDFPTNVWTDNRSSGTFTFAATDTNFDHYQYGLDTPTPGTALAAGTASVTLSGIADGWHHLYARGVDKAGNLGPIKDYPFGTGGVPAAPSTVTGTRGDQQVSLSWTAPATNGSTVSAYVIKTYVGGTAVATRTVGAVTSTSMTGLDNGTTYTFGVAATNSAGTGSERISAPVNPAGPPSAPALVRVAPRDGQAFVRWSPSMPNGSPVTGYTVTAYSGTVAVTAVTVGAVSTATISGLTNGTQYTFKVKGTNTSGTGAESVATGAVTPAPWAFSFDGGAAVGADPNAGFVADVNPGLGSFTSSATDATVATMGPALSLTRSYNSIDTSDTGFGIGWTSSLAMGWQSDSAGNIVVLYPDGRRETHTHNSDGSYTHPTAYPATLVSNGSGFTLTETDGTAYTLGSNHKVTTITDPAGHQESLSYDSSGQLTTVTAFSGRQLHFSWTNGHVSSVATDNVSATQGPLTWTYAYATVDGAVELTSVCDPRGTGADHCTHYAYTAGLLTTITRPSGSHSAIVTYNGDGTVLSRDDGLGNVTDFDLTDPARPAITDPLQNTTTETVDSSKRLTAELDPGTQTAAQFGYDANGFRNSVQDQNLNTTTATFDSKGNVLQTQDANLKTAHSTYDAANNLTSSCDERSASLTDTTYCTTYSYDAHHNKLTETTPGGATRRWTYSDGTEPAVGGTSTIPADLLLTESDFRGDLTHYGYTAGGDLAETTTPLGQRTSYAYDAVGRKISETVFSNTFPNGVTTSWTYDGLGTVLSETGPAVTNVVTGVAHQLRKTNSYDVNGNLTSVTQADLLGGDPSRTTTYTYDSLDRQLSSTDNETGQSTSRTYDARGNVATVTDQLGRVTTTSYDAMSRPTTVTGPDGVPLRQTSYDDAGRVLTETDALGEVKAYTYDNDGRVLKIELTNFVDPDGTSRSVVLEQHTYDAAGYATDDYNGGNLQHVHKTFNTSGQVVSSTMDPGGLNRTTSYTYDVDGNTLTTSLSDGQRTENTSNSYDANNDVLSTTVSTGTTSLVTTATFDTRGIQTSSTDGRGNVLGADPVAYTTRTTTDELGRTVEVELPPVSVETNGGSASIARPTSYTGYDTFGDATQVKDANGNVTTSVFDRLGRKTSVTYPAYTAPAGATLTPTESWTFDAVGNETGHVDRRGASYSYDFDDYNRVIAAYDPLLSGQASRGVTRTSYDDLGQKTSVVDQNGATTRWTYDALGRMRTQTAVVRQSDGTTVDDTTSHVYDDLGDETETTDPTGNVSSATFDAAGDRLTSTDASGAVTAYAYDVAGRQVSSTDPLGRVTATSFDLAGREVSQSRYDHLGALLTTQLSGYDAAGNQTSKTSARGYVTTMGYDAANRLTSVITPGDHGEGITTAAGYDPVGNMTRFTDGRGNTTVRTYTTANLLESTVEPATTAQPSSTDRTWTTSYDAAGQAVRENQPGGVTVTRSFDAMGRLLSENGTGTGVASASRTFGYDLVGQRTSLSAPGGQNSYTFDDLGLLTQASGPSGTASFDYDAAGRITERQDTTGTSTFDYNTRGLLSSSTDQVADTTRNFSYDTAGQLTSVAFAGPGGAASHRDYSYDDLGRLATDQLLDASGSVKAGYSYGYNADGNVTRKTITLPDNSAAGAHTYTYDQQDRLKSWTAPGGATKSYAWDGAGNRTQAGADAFTYDQRNRQLSGPDGTRTWSPTGNLLTISSGTGQKTYSYDAFNRVTGASMQAQAATYSYDSIDRLLARNGIALTYAGTAIKPVSDGTEQFARSVDDSLLAVSDGATASLGGTDVHHDLTYLADPDGSISGSRVYDPFGTLAASVGTITGTLGYQSDVTDATTGDVWMGARWYGPANDTFLSQDSVTGTTTEPESLNRYTYANGDPVENIDSDGHAAIRMLYLTSPMMRGTDVKAAQGRLRTLGYPIAADGIFGPHTRDAVTSFQSKHQLANDGIIGPKTLAKLCPSTGGDLCRLLLAPLLDSSSTPSCGTTWIALLMCGLTPTPAPPPPPLWEQKVGQCQKQASRSGGGTKACDEGAFLYLKKHAPAGHSKALSNVPAAAVVGNWMYESGGGHVNPYSIEWRKACTNEYVAGCGIGFAQWTYPTRKQGLFDLARKRGVRWTNFHLQLDYALGEMGKMGSFYTNLQGMSRLSDATRYVENVWERPQDPEGTYTPRYNNARSVLSAYGGVG